MIDLSELDLGSGELGEISLETAGDYQYQTDPLPPPEVNYSFRALDATFDEDMQTKARKYDVVDGRKYPIIVIPQVEIVEPEEVNGSKLAGRKVGVFQRFKTRPIDRLGATVNEFTDLLVSFDSNTTFGSIEEGLALLNGFIANGATFRGRGRWKSFDTKYADAEFEKVGGRENASKEDVKRIMKGARVIGARNFDLGKDGKTRLATKTGLSGATLNAKFEISRLYPSHEKVKLGQ